MSGFKFSKFFGLSDDEDYELEDERGYDEQEYSTETSSSSVANGQTANMDGQRRTATVGNQDKKIVALNGGQPVQQSKIIVFEPRVYSEVQEIADHLLNFQSVIINFSSIDEEQAKRTVDFLTGTVYAANGDIQRIGDEIFLCTPANVEINTTLTDSLKGRNLF